MKQEIEAHAILKKEVNVKYHIEFEAVLNNTIMKFDSIAIDTKKLKCAVCGKKIKPGNIDYVIKELKFVDNVSKINLTYEPIFYCSEKCLIASKI